MERTRSTCGDPPRLFRTGMRSAFAGQAALVIGRGGTLSAQTDIIGTPVKGQVEGRLCNTCEDAVRVKSGPLRLKETAGRWGTGPAEHRNAPWRKEMTSLVREWVDIEWAELGVQL